MDFGISTDFNNAATDAVAFATALRAVGQPAQAGATAIIRLVQVVDRLVSVGGPRLVQVADVADMTVEAFKGLFEVDPGDTESAMTLRFVLSENPASLYPRFNFNLLTGSVKLFLISKFLPFRYSTIITW